MPAPCPLPVRASVRDLLADLLGRAVTVTAGTPQELADSPAYAAVYVRDDGTTAAVSVWSQPVAVAAASAIDAAARGGLEAAPAAGGLEDDLRDGFREVVNVLAKLLNSPSTPHVRLDAFYDLPGRVPATAAPVILQPARRSDYDVTVTGSGVGKVTFLLA